MENEVEYSDMTSRVNQGGNIRKIRHILNMKQDMLAELLGTTQQMVSRIEGRRVVEEDTIVKIANIFNISPKIIQELEENPLSVVIENNTFESGSYNGGGIINGENQSHHQHNIHPLDKIMELSKQTGELYERMLALEKEKNELLERLLNEKK